MSVAVGERCGVPARMLQGGWLPETYAQKRQGGWECKTRWGRGGGPREDFAGWVAPRNLCPEASGGLGMSDAVGARWGVPARILQGGWLLETYA